MTRNPVTDLDCKYGAPMGRPTFSPSRATRFLDAMGPEYQSTTADDARNILATAAKSMKLSLRRIRLDSGGYDSGGAYWGFGQPLYWAGSEDGIIDMWFRAPGREAAKAHVRHEIPNASFYR